MTLLLPLALSFGLMQAGHTPPPRLASGTCEIRGRITDQESGRPIPRAVVHLALRHGRDERTATTDDEGKYEFTALLPGEYSGIAEGGPFRVTHQAGSLVSPGDNTRRGLIVLRAGDRVNVDVALRRTLAITVRVVNEWGQPLAGVGVTANSEVGVSDYHRSMSRRTDDRGRVRLFGIPPGRYIVCAASSSISYAGAPRTEQRDRFLQTCYPSAPGEAQAEPVALERSDIEDLQIRMRRGRTFTISGTVLDASGTTAAGAFVSFAQFSRNSGSSFGNALDADGRFSFSNVPPGEYAIEASIGGPDRPEDRRELERGLQPVRVDASDVKDLVLTLAKAVDVTGRIVFEDSDGQLQRPTEPAELFISARLSGAQLPLGEGMESTATGDDRTFVLTGMFGRRVLEVANVPRGSYVKSIRYRGEEILDLPTEFKAGTDPSELEVILSTRGAIVSGRVLDDRGEPVSGAHVLLLPAEPFRWTMFQFDSERSSETGAFQLGPRRGGDYLIVALAPSARSPDPDDRTALAQLMEAAERITLGSEERRTLDLHVVKDR